MWEVKQPKPVKLIIGIMAADRKCLKAAVKKVKEKFGEIDLESETWDFEKTDYYLDELGRSPVKQFVTVDQLIDPGELAEIKHKTNDIEKELSKSLKIDLPRPVNLDPGYIESSKLVLASTKNFSHRIYIGKNMYAEVTLMYHKGTWKGFDYTFPDHKEDTYHKFFDKVRAKLKEQLRSTG